MHSSSVCQPAAECLWSLPHVQIAGLHWSRPSARRTLALHGWLDNAASFQPLAAHLDVDLYAMDWAGHGRSGHRPPGGYSGFMGNLEELLAVSAALGDEPLDLIGHSMGGALACLYAAAFPERVRRLVLIEAIGPVAAPPERYARDLRRALEARRDFNDRRRTYASMDELVEARRKAGPLSAASARLLLERGTESSPEGLRFRSDPRETLPSLQRGSEAQVLAALAAITCPTQLILAEPATSYLSGPAAEARIAALRPRVVHRLPGQHHLHMDDPDTVAPLIAQFLAAAD